MTDDDRPFGFLRVNRRQAKPRTRGLTEIRGPYYTPLGPRYLEDLLDTVGHAVDGLKFGGGSFAVMTRGSVRRIIELCHARGAWVSTGGFVEYVLTQGEAAVERYLGECRELGFDIVEVSAGFVTLPADAGGRAVRAAGDDRGEGPAGRPAVRARAGAGGPVWRPEAGGPAVSRAGDVPGGAGRVRVGRPGDVRGRG